MTQTCPDTHKHAATTTCYHSHGCRCVACTNNINKRERDRRRQQAYGRFEGHQDPTGTIRRVQGLQVLGWSMQDIADAAGYAERSIVRRFVYAKWVKPDTRDRVAAAYETLMRRGTGTSWRSARRAVAKGWVSPYAWDDIDDPAAKPARLERDGVLRGDALFDEIEHLYACGESAHHIAQNVGRTPEGLERASFARGRKDLAAFFHEAAAPRQYPSRKRATEYGSEHRERGAA